MEKIGKDYEPPKLISKKELVSYNLDEKFRDQFIYSIKENNSENLVVKWFDHVERKVDGFIEGEWSNKLSDRTKNVVFSTKGSYLAVCEPEGVRILAGDNLVQIGFYRHEGVTDVAFSTNETFMISHNKISENVRGHERYIIWSVESQLSLKEYKGLPHQSLASFQFNNDETRLAIIREN